MENGGAFLLTFFLLCDNELSMAGSDGVGVVPAWSGFQYNLVGVGLRKVDVTACVVLDALEVAEVEHIGFPGLVAVVYFLDTASGNRKNGHKGD